MKITAIYFMPPGRGETLSKSIVMDGNDLPSVPDVAQRSVKAITYFWPKVVPGEVLRTKVQRDRLIVEGMSWQVEWVTDAYAAEREDYLKRSMAGQVTYDEIIARAEAIEAEMVCPT